VVPVIVIDLDETVLDTGDFQTMLIKNHSLKENFQTI